VRVRTTLHLLLAVSLLGAGIWFLERRFASTGERRSRNARVLDVRGDEVTALTVQTDALQVKCLRKDGEWQIVHPLEARADDHKVNHILDTLESLLKEEVVTREQRRARGLDLADYGLRAPRATFGLINRLGRTELRIGVDAPLGDLVYVGVAGNESVFATSGAIADLIPAGIEELRERAILPGETARTGRLEIERPDRGFIQFSRRDGPWMIQQPITGRADGGKVMKILDALYALSVSAFIWDPPVSSAAGGRTEVVEADAVSSLAVYGLGADEATTVSVWIQGDEVGKGLMLGKPVPDRAGEVYAKRRQGDSIYAVSDGILELLTVGVNDLRDPALFAVTPAEVGYAVFQQGDRKLVLVRRETGGWLIREPVQWPADEQAVASVLDRITRWQVDSFVEEPAGDPADFGLDRPAFEIFLARAAPDAAANGAAEGGGAGATEREPEASGRLLIAAADGADGTVFARFDDPPDVFRITVDPLRDPGGPLVDPLFYRDRTMLSVPVDSVKRMVVRNGARVRSVARDGADGWTATAPETNEVNLAVVEEMLFLAGNLRALWIESYNPKRPEAYGLSDTGSVLTLGLSGEEGIQISILVGSEAGPNAVYAMIQGRDLVFALSRENADRLLTDPTRAPAGGAEPASPAAPAAEPESGRDTPAPFAGSPEGF